MSDTTIIALLIFFAAIIALLVIYVIRGKKRMRDNPNQFNWQPEQDYDVELKGETAMTPGFPVLKKRPGKDENEPEKK